MESATREIKNALGIHLPSSLDYAGTFLTKISPKDKFLLQKTIAKFRPDSKNYEDSWGYLIQSARYKGFKWYDKENHSLIFFGRKSDTDSTLVVPLFFANPDYLKEVVEKVQNIFGAKRTILKNVNRTDVKLLLHNGFRKYRENEFWSKDARFDDQTYPQQIVSLERLAEIKGPKYHHLRQALNKKPNVYLREYRKEDKDRVFEIFALRDGNTKDTLGKEHGMYYVSHAMYPDSHINKYVVIDEEKNEILGFIASSDISSKNVALVASIFKPGVKIASVWAIYNVLIEMYKKGFKFVNLGGCETEGTYSFLKRKFRPVEKLKKTHLIFSKENFKN